MRCSDIKHNALGVFCNSACGPSRRYTRTANLHHTHWLTIAPFSPLHALSCMHRTTLEREHEKERERGQERQSERDILVAIFTGIPKALGTFIALHHVMLAQQGFYVIGKLGGRRHGYYSHFSSRTSNVYKCGVAMYTNAL